MRIIIDAAARYFTGQPLLLAFLAVGVADFASRAAMNALGFAV